MSKCSLGALSIAAISHYSHIVMWWGCSQPQSFQLKQRQQIRCQLVVLEARGNKKCCSRIVPNTKNNNPGSLYTAMSAQQKGPVQQKKAKKRLLRVVTRAEQQMSLQPVHLQTMWSATEITGVSIHMASDKSESHSWVIPSITVMQGRQTRSTIPPQWIHPGNRSNRADYPPATSAYLKDKLWTIMAQTHSLIGPLRRAMSKMCGW